MNVQQRTTTERPQLLKELSVAQVVCGCLWVVADGSGRTLNMLSHHTVRPDSLTIIYHHRSVFFKVGPGSPFLYPQDIADTQEMLVFSC